MINNQIKNGTNKDRYKYAEQAKIKYKIMVEKT